MLVPSGIFPLPFFILVFLIFSRLHFPLKFWDEPPSGVIRWRWDQGIRIHITCSTSSKTIPVQRVMFAIAAFFCGEKRLSALTVSLAQVDQFALRSAAFAGVGLHLAHCCAPSPTGHARIVVTSNSLWPRLIFKIISAVYRSAIGDYTLWCPVVIDHWSNSLSKRGLYRHSLLWYRFPFPLTCSYVKDILEFCSSALFC